ncbi:DNA-binding protein [Halobacteriales archaeon QS_8_69_26]|nr:MAG: DNA-binding protein [Halobacteriales archaeon QS_8_69_26]
MWLEDEYHVRTATGGQEAIDDMDDDVEVVLLDRRMPEMTGDEVLERIREDGYDCEVAMVTAVDPDFDIVDLPFDAYVTKPLMPEDLNGVVSRLLDLEEDEEVTREGFRLRETRDALAEEKHEKELEESEEFDRLTTRLEELREEVKDTVESINERDSDGGTDD